MIHIIEGWTRELGIPLTWKAKVKNGEATLHNAARPFPASEQVTGEFVHGIFYGIIYNSDDQAKHYRKRAKELDASEIVFIKHETVEDWGRKYCQKHNINYDDYSFDDIAKSWLNHHMEENLL